MVVNIIMCELLAFWARPFDYITTRIFRISACRFDADYGCVDDVRVVEKYIFEFWWCDLKTADFDEFLDFRISEDVKISENAQLTFLRSTMYHNFVFESQYMMSPVWKYPSSSQLLFASGLSR